MHDKCVGAAAARHDGDKLTCPSLYVCLPLPLQGVRCGARRGTSECA